LQDELMEMKRIITNGLLLVASVLVVGAVAGWWSPGPLFASPRAQASGANSLPPAERAAANAPTIVIAKVSVSSQQQRTIVSVAASGAPIYQATHLRDPERVVLDFQRARLAIPSITPSSYAPVFRIRAAQFKPDVVRVVVDLQENFPYSVNLDEHTVTVEFGAAASAPKPALPPGPPAGAGERPGESPAAATSTATPSPPAPSSISPPMSPQPPRSARVPSKSEPLPIEPGFSNGMLTFRVQNESLRSVLARISTQSGIAIYMPSDLGNEPLSMEFRQYRIDEALRQLLKDYDTFFFYAGDDGNPAATSLKAIWVYPEGRGPRSASFK
jgi:hypothetical protein